MEDFKEKYEQALERAKNYHKGHTLDVNPQAAMEYIFPELKESEDEKMRKDLINTFNTYYKNQPEGEWDGKKVKDILAWLEKQGENQSVEGTFINVDDARDDFMSEVYRVLDADTTNDRANQIIQAFDSLPTVAIKKQGEESIVTDILTKAGIKPYKDGNKWCILVGDNIQEGICGFGDTVNEALLEFLNELLEKQGNINNINEKLRQYREYLVKETERWHKKEEDETLSKIGKQDCIGHANAYISARAEFENLFNYDAWLEQKLTDTIKPKFKVGVTETIKYMIYYTFKNG